MKSCAMNEEIPDSIGLARWLNWGILVAVVLSCAEALSLNLADPDLWGHVQYGRDALDDGLPKTTTYSYIAEGYPWINHEILAELALALGADRLGPSGLLIGKCLLGVALIGVMLRRALRQGVRMIAACGLVLLVAAALGGQWTLRPQLASYACFTLLLALLSYCFEGWEGHCQFPQPWLACWLRRRLEATATAGGEGRSGDLPSLVYSAERLKLLWLAPLLFAVWTNTHGGFLAGLCVYVAYLGLRSFEAVLHNGRRAKELLCRFGLMTGAAVTATFLNPYSFKFHLWLFDDLRVPRPEIVEWRAPELFNPQFTWFWLLAAAALAAVLFSKRSRDATHVAILGLILWQALLHHRHIPFFAIAAGWWLPLHFDSLLARLGLGAGSEKVPGTFSAAEKVPGTFSGPVQLGLALLLVCAIVGAGVRLASRLANIQVDRQRYPVSAVDYIARQGLTGKMVVTFNWAQYALAALGAREPQDPGIQVQIDGRCRTSYSQEMLDMHFDFVIGDAGPSMRYRDLASGPFDSSRVLEVGRPDLVLISRRQQPSVQTMEQQKSKWVLLYQDGLAQVWGRAAKYDDPKSSHYLPRARREIGDSPQLGFVTWPALPKYKTSSASGNHCLLGSSFVPLDVE